MKSKLLILFSFLSLIQIQAQNLISNPGFETGGSGIGFVTNGAGYTQLVTPFSGTTVPGNFGVANFPKRLNTADFNFEGDRTTGAGRMLIIDGNTTPGTPFWSAGNTGGGVTTAVVGTTYYFSYWIKSVSDLVTDPTTQANIDVQVTGGNLVTLLSGSTLAPLPADGWKQVLYSFVATATTVQISLSNSNGNAVGNDFAVDDFVLRSSLILTANATNALCAVPNDGSITATAFGGTAPYTYTLSGAGTGTNTTGVFTGLAPGVYTVAVVDSTTPTAASTTLTNIVVGPRLSITANTAICIGSSATLEVGGSPSTYTWTASPADSSLTTPNSDTVVVSPTVTTTYTATSTVGSCAPLTRTVQVTVNQLPVATLPADITICPGNSASVTITGTPQSTVTLVDYGTFPNPTTYTVNIPASGTVNWVTPALQETHTYTMTNVRNFFTFCERQYTNEEIVILVIPNGCATVETVPAPGTKPLDLTLCTTNECRTLEANISDVPSTTSYAVTSIPFCPQAPFENPSWIQLYPLPPTDTRTLGDDDWHDVFNFPAGMNFCFFGNNYTSLQVGTNGIITFKYHPQTPPLDFPRCRWDYNLPIPNTDYVNDANLARDVSNSIMGVYQDTNFAVPNQAPNFKNINYQVVGTYPCRKFIVNYKDLPQFSCGNDIGVSTTQIVLYEVSNIIEVYVLRRTACTGWNGGRGIIGIMDATGTQGYAAPGRNAVPFNTDPTPSDPNNFDNVSEAWRFTPTGPNIPMSVSWYEGTTQIGTGPTVTVCPSATTTYTLKAEYSICNVIQTATSDITLNVNPDVTNSPVNLTECSNIFNLEENTPIILGSLTPSLYEITYHLTAAEADLLANPISTPTAFTSNGQTIYAAIYLSLEGCTIVKPFQLIVDDCGPVTPPDLTLCETSYGSADAIFDLTPQIAVALGSNDPADYVVTLHLNLADANGDVSPISPTNNFTGVNGQEIFVRMESSTDPTQFEVTSFTLIVNPIPTATISGTTSICEGDTTTITFTGTPNAVVTYTINSGSNQTISLDATGNATISMAYTADTTYTLVSVQNPTTLCSQTLTGSAVVTVNPIPTATISGTTTVCQGDANPVITFTAANGTTPYTFNFIDSSGNPQSVTVPGNTHTIPVSTATQGTFTYQLVSVSSSGTPVCSQPQSGTATVTVNPLPTATISGTTTICSGDSATVTFTGTPDAVVNYLVNPGTTGSVTLNASGSATITSAYTTSTSYTLINVTNPATTCSQLVGGIATITVNPLPTATISGTTTVCQGAANPSITFTGANATAPYTFTYLDQNNATQTITTTVGNSVTVPVSTANGGTFNYQLLSVSSASTPACSQPQSGTATVTVVTLPTASISGTATTCLNFAEPQVVLTGFNGTAPYTFTYSLDTVVQPPVTSTGNSYTINVPTTASGTFVYQLISVASSGTPVCSQPQTGTVTIVVNDAPI
ncbi:hypothetical protein G6042_01770, partial [Flavobacterium sp. SE-s27]|nr:hypothetical protein [Flavobacterium solisilvae]